jgi:arginine utilization protein RocB
MSFMRETLDYAEPWRRADNDREFGALATLYLARLLERYLRYFLEREASAYTVNIRRRDALDAELSRVTDHLAVLALETAPIATGYAAAWYNKHMRRREPTDPEIRSFVAYALKKLADEVGREGAFAWRSGL